MKYIFVDESWEDYFVIKDPPLGPLPRGEISYEHN